MDRIFDVWNNPEKLRQARMKAYRSIFAKTIKESFLVDVLDKVEHNPRYINVYVNEMAKFDFTILQSIKGSGNLSSLDTCKMIVMKHYNNCVMLSDSEKGKLQSSEKYKKDLVNDVVDMYMLEELATPDFSQTALESYFPLLYYASTLNNYCGIKYDELFEQNKEFDRPYNYVFNKTMLYKIIFKIKSCVALANIRSIDEMIIIFRSLIELFMTYSALWDKDDKTIDSYHEFEDASFEFNYNGKILDKFKRAAKEHGVNEVQYLNYGWLINLKEYAAIEDMKKLFKIGSLAKILDKKCGYFDKEFGSSLYAAYKFCNPQTHGTTKIMNYFQVELFVFQNIAVMLKFICEVFAQKLFNFDFEINNLNLIDKLNESLGDSRTIYEWLSNNQDALRKTNIDYRDRVYCSFRMKK